MSAHGSGWLQERVSDRWNDLAISPLVNQLEFL